jgi:hypothetical protein
MNNESPTAPGDRPGAAAALPAVPGYEMLEELAADYAVHPEALHQRCLLSSLRGLPVPSCTNGLGQTNSAISLPELD